MIQEVWVGESSQGRYFLLTDGSIPFVNSSSHNGTEILNVVHALFHGRKKGGVLRMAFVSRNLGFTLRKKPLLPLSSLQCPRFAKSNFFIKLIRNQKYVDFLELIYNIMVHRQLVFSELLHDTRLPKSIKGDGYICIDIED